MKIKRQIMSSGRPMVAPYDVCAALLLSLIHILTLPTSDLV